MTGQNKSDIIFHIRRYNPERDGKPYWQDYLVQPEAGMTVLDGLREINESQDQTLNFRSSCGMGVCGSCGMLINGRPALACSTQILDITDRDLTIAPLPNFDIVKDLVPELTPLFIKHSSVYPYIINNEKDEMARPTGEFYQNQQELTEYLQFTYCIKCGICMSACPTLCTDPEYLGPQALTQAYRYNKDSRDEGFSVRKDIVSRINGVFKCHYAGECSNVCPKGVDPARAIQLLKRELVLNYMKLQKEKVKCKVCGKRKDYKRRPEIPEAPPFNVS
ncbi:succinate dehydrogenase iron-sulfur subunit [Deltaproteobacteria bacterium]|nr:succinate dehydrogenase iron-sulfur subunit [Deltaproteobacteria bacterium]